jgi:hypothetical protein
MKIEQQVKVHIKIWLFSFYFPASSDVTKNSAVGIIEL